METAIAVFSTRGRAEEAVKALLESHVPEKSIVYLTRSESEAKTVAKQFGAVAGGIVGGAAGMTAGVAAAARNITLDKPPPDGLKLPPV